MAEYNSIDLALRSQDLSSDFYQYHRRFGGIWYIKNCEGQLFDCSDDFLSFSSAKCTRYELIDKTEIIMSDLFGGVVDSLIHYERNVSIVSPRIILLVVAYRNNILTPNILTINRTDFGVYVKIDSLSFMGVENLILHSLGIKNKKVFSKKIKIERLYGIHPFLSMREQEWCVAWLMSIGFSKSEIASYLNVSDTVVKKRMSKIYRALLLKNHSNFMRASELLLWRSFIPPSVLSKPSVSVLNLDF